MGFWEGTFGMLVKHEFNPTLSDVYKGRPSKEEVWRITQRVDRACLSDFDIKWLFPSQQPPIWSRMWQNDCLEWLLPWGSWRLTKSQAVFPDKVTVFLHHSLNFLDSESLEQYTMHFRNEVFIWNTWCGGDHMPQRCWETRNIDVFPQRGLGYPLMIWEVF